MHADSVAQTRWTTFERHIDVTANDVFDLFPSTSLGCGTCYVVLHGAEHVAAITVSFSVAYANLEFTVTSSAGGQYGRQKTASLEVVRQERSDGSVSLGVRPSHSGQVTIAVPMLFTEPGVGL
jgi:hypothetical protein